MKKTIEFNPSFFVTLEAEAKKDGKKIGEYIEDMYDYIEAMSILDSNEPIYTHDEVVAELKEKNVLAPKLHTTIKKTAEAVV